MSFKPKKIETGVTQTLGSSKMNFPSLIGGTKGSPIDAMGGTSNSQPEVFLKQDVEIYINEEQITTGTLTMELNQKLQEHTECKLTFYVPKFQRSFYQSLMNSEEDSTIRIWINSNKIIEIPANYGETPKSMQDGKHILNGVIDYVNYMETAADGDYVEIVAYSMSILADRVPKYRSFQEAQLSYKAPIDYIASTYAGAEQQSLDTDKANQNDGSYMILGSTLKQTKIPHMTMQLQTDWNYLKRIASLVGQPVFPYVDKILIGFEEDFSPNLVNVSSSIHGRVRSNRRQYYKIKGTEVQNIGNIVELKIQQTDKIQTADGIQEEKSLSEDKFYVVESKVWTQDEILVCEYLLADMKGFRVDPIPHAEIKGMVVEARSIHIARTDGNQSGHGRDKASSENLTNPDLAAVPKSPYDNNTITSKEAEAITGEDIAVMTIDFTEGLIKIGGGNGEEDLYKGKMYFPYLTPYSKTNTGFAPEPQANDKVAVYFPTENEAHAYVMGAVNNETSGRFTNPDKRNFASSPSGSGSSNSGKPQYNFEVTGESFVVNVGSVIDMTSKVTANLTAKNTTISGGSTIDLNCKSSTTSMTNSNITTKSSNMSITGTSNTKVGGGSKTVVTGGKVKVN